MCPGVFTKTGAIDIALVLVGLVGPNGGIDVDICEEGATGVVVAAEDTTLNGGVVAGVVDVGLINVAGEADVLTVSTAEDTSAVGNAIALVVRLIRISFTKELIIP